MKSVPIFATVIMVSAGAASAFAARPASWLDGDQNLRVASGEAARIQRTLSETPNKRQAIAWEAFQTAHGETWNVSFDSATGVAVRVYGRGIPVQGSMASPPLAEQAARRLLAQQLALLAPGSTPGDFELASDVAENNLRTVAFFQTHRGQRVVGGQVSFLFKNDRLFMFGSDASPNIAVKEGAAIAANLAQRAAERWLARDYGSTLVLRSVEGPMILPLVRVSGALEHHRVLEVKLEARNPLAAWSVWIDATTAQPIARKQTLKFADGTLMMNAPERWPGDVRTDYAALYTNLNVDSAMVTADDLGVFSWAGNDAATVTARANGTLVSVLNDSGAEANQTFSIQPAGTSVWNAADQEQVDAQLVTYIHAHRAKERAKSIAPGATWLDDQLSATVNIQDTCNAFSDGETINFFVSGRGCENTGRLPDVIHHEFGHAVHAHAIIRGIGNFDDALSEGGADYFAATITNDHGMGRGFFFNNDPLRDIDPPSGERVWPNDINPDPHETGLIYAGAMWDLRKKLIDHLGEQPGIEHTDSLWYQVFERASDIPTSYATVIAADDDDGDLTNGTPNICDINEAFAAHGLAPDSATRPGIGLPLANGLTITLPVAAGQVCPGTNIQRSALTWQLRRDPSKNGTLEMNLSAEGFTATIPSPAMTNEVVQYRVDVTLETGTILSFPENLADPLYELYVGAVVPIYCTDFEADPMLDGWSHVLEAGQASQGADDWQWGAPAGTSGSGDPSQAFSGTSVYGNDLGGGMFNGKYQADKRNALISPEVDTTGFNVVRLQYRRWLNVEDGFYDRARIIANDQTVWQNVATNDRGEKPHQDKEWRFQDVELTPAISDARVQIKFEIESDQGLEFGGWTIDDLCIVGVNDVVVPRCGDGVLNEGEACDDGNTADGDGCSAGCTVEAPDAVCGNGALEAGEACDDGNVANGDGCSASCAVELPVSAVCGNGQVESGEACDDGVLDGTHCAAGCVLPSSSMNPDDIKTLDDAGGCGCTSAGEAPETSWGSLLLFGLLGLPLAFRRRG